MLIVQRIDKTELDLFLCIGLITGNGETESIRGILVIVFGVIGAIGTIFAAIGTIIAIISTCKHHKLYFLELCISTVRAARYQQK